LPSHRSARLHAAGPAELEFMLRRSNARLLVCAGQRRGGDGAARRHGPRADRRRHLLRRRRERGRHGARWSELERDVANPSAGPEAPSAPDDIILIVYAYGITSEPKGVLPNHASLLADTLFHLAPLLDAAEASGHDLSSLVDYLAGATPIAPALIARCARHGLATYRALGLTEHPAISMGHPSDALERRLTTDGRLCANIDAASSTNKASFCRVDATAKSCRATRRRLRPLPKRSPQCRRTAARRLAAHRQQRRVPAHAGRQGAQGGVAPAPA
jgi:hypothetical protein